jgi:hypothetical protein
MTRALIFLLLTTCCAFSDEADKSNAIRAASLKEGLCTLHHVKLDTTIAYEFAPARAATCDPSASALKLYTKYPNCKPPCTSFTKDDDFNKPFELKYCPVCQQQFMKKVKPDSKS